MKKATFLFFSILFISLNSVAQQYKDWDDHDVEGFYEKKEISVGYDALDENGNDMYASSIVYYESTSAQSGTYEIEIGDKINSKLYQIKGTDLYIKFRYSPYLYRYDEGILEVSYGSGTFYEKP